MTDEQQLDVARESVIEFTEAPGHAKLNPSDLVKGFIEYLD
jgi:hypothetical protein